MFNDSSILQIAGFAGNELFSPSHLARESFSRASPKDLLTDKGPIAKSTVIEHDRLREGGEAGAKWGIYQARHDSDLMTRYGK